MSQEPVLLGCFGTPEVWRSSLVRISEHSSFSSSAFCTDKINNKTASHQTLLNTEDRLFFSVCLRPCPASSLFSAVCVSAFRPDRPCCPLLSSLSLYRHHHIHFKATLHHFGSPTLNSFIATLFFFFVFFFLCSSFHCSRLHLARPPSPTSTFSPSLSIKHLLLRLAR
jgi:hypothetical protein